MAPEGVVDPASPNVATGIYRLAPSVTGASVAASVLPSIGSPATQDIWQEFRILPTAEQGTASPGEGAWSSEELTYVRLTTTGVEYEPPF